MGQGWTVISGWGTEKGCNVPEESRSHTSGSISTLAKKSVWPLWNISITPLHPHGVLCWQPFQEMQKNSGADNGKQRGWTRAGSHSCCADGKSDSPARLADQSVKQLPGCKGDGIQQPLAQPDIGCWVTLEEEKKTEQTGLCPAPHTGMSLKEGRPEAGGENKLAPLASDSQMGGDPLQLLGPAMASSGPTCTGVCPGEEKNPTAISVLLGV